MPHRRRHPLISLVLLIAGASSCDAIGDLLPGSEEPEVAAAAAPGANAEAEPERTANGGGAVETEPSPGAAPSGDAAVGAPDGAPVRDPAKAGSIDASAPALPCIIGSWDAVEYTEAVRRAIAKDPQLRSVTKTSSGGHITYVLDPPTDGSGTMRATADHLRYTFAGTVQGMKVTVKLDIDGDTESTYRLEGDDRIVIAKPESNTMKVEAKVSVKGLGATRKRKGIDLDFDGSFSYACTDQTLEVWRGERRGRSMEFARAGAS